MIKKHIKEGEISIERAVEVRAYVSMTLIFRLPRLTSVISNHLARKTSTWRSFIVPTLVVVLRSSFNGDEW